MEEYDLKKGLVNPRNPKILDRTVKQSRPATEGDNGRPTGGTQLGPEPEELWLTGGTGGKFGQVSHVKAWKRGSYQHPQRGHQWKPPD